MATNRVPRIGRLATIIPGQAAPGGGHARMSRQRNPGRRWRDRWAADHPRSTSVQLPASLLDSVSLTAIMTDPSPRTLPEDRGDARDLLTAVSASGEILTARPTARPDRDAETEEVRKRMSVRNSALLGTAFVILCAGLVAGGVIGSTSATTPPPHSTTGGPQATRLAVHPAHLNLSPATSTAAPAPPSVALTSTSPHEVFGYAPYWSMSNASSFPVGDFSTIAYFSVDVNPNGSIEQSGPGWTGYESQNLVDLVTRAHQAGVRVVLTATDFSQASLDTLTHDPGAADILGANLLALVETKRLDGVNLDLEGVGSADRAGLDRLVSRVSFLLRLADPHYQVTMATYASSATDPGGFYDISGLAPSVDAFFVMAYDVNQGTAGQPGEKGEGVERALRCFVHGCGAGIEGDPWGTTVRLRHADEWARPRSDPDGHLTACDVHAGDVVRHHLLGSLERHGVDRVPVERTVAPGVLRQRELTRPQGAIGNQLEPTRDRRVGARHARFG